jgi:glycosyltransferase involved in cell wall biosynthesis
MASGLAVVGTTTGGSREILEDGVNSLTFRAEEAKDLARQLRRLFNPRSLDQLAGEARRTIENRFTVTDMMTRIEAFLWSAVGRFA